MPDIIFARTRTPYDSYQDFWRLVELSDFPTCYVDEIQPDSDHTYIFTPDNGETRNGWAGARARIIHYQLEWETHPNDQNPLPPGVAEKWTMDAWHAQRISARYVPIGSHPGLVHAPLNGTMPIHYDVAFMAYREPGRRMRVILDMQRKGIRIAPDGWNEQRHQSLVHSKAMVHIHQHDAIPGVAALRLALAAAYRLPVITETCADYGIFAQGDLLRCDYGYLADFAHMWVCRNDTQMLQDYGNALYGTLCERHTFRKCIEAAL